MMTARIAGIGAYVPENLITNDDLAKIVDTNDEWIRTRTGIRERRISSGEGTRHLAAKAAERALAAAGVAPEELDIIILGTSSPDRNYPSDACSVQAAIGAVNAVAFDISAACAGFIFAMNIVEGFFKAGIYKTALIIGAETLSKVTDWSDRGTCVLFGDGAGAAIFRLADTPFALTLGARGSDVLHAGGPDRNGSAPITMDGKAVFRFAVDALPRCLHTVLDETGKTLDEVDWVVCHQANSRIIDHCVRALKADPAKFYKNMDRHGNTSAASIPVALNELAETGQLQPGQTAACIGFGGGLTWGGMIVEYDPARF